MDARTALGLVGLCLAALVAPAGARAQDGWSTGGVRITLDAGLTFDTLSGSVAIDGEAFLGGPGIPGTEVDVEDDLGLEQETNRRAGLRLQFGPLWLMGSFHDVTIEGSNVLTRTITLDGEVYTAGALIKTKIELAHFEGRIGIRIIKPDPEENPFELGIGLGVHVFDLALTAAGQTDLGPLSFAAAAGEDLTLPVPVLGLLMALHPADRLSIELEGWGMLVPEYQGFEGYLVDAALTIKFYVIENLCIGGRVGFQRLSFDVDVGDPGVDRVRGGLDFDSLQAGVVLGLSF